MRRMHAKELLYWGFNKGELFVQKTTAFFTGWYRSMKLSTSQLIYEVQGGKECRSKKAGRTLAIFE